MDKLNIARQLFIEGLQFFESGKFKQAEVVFIKSLQVLPDRVSTLINLSATQLKLKKYQEAKESSLFALSLEVDNREALINLGLIEKECKNLLSALDYFNQVIVLSPTDVESHFIKGTILVDLHRIDEAICCFNNVLVMDPKHVNCLSILGDTLFLKKCLKGALTRYEKLTTMQPSHSNGWFKKGATLFELGRYNDALLAYDKALDITPDFAEALYNQGLCLHELKRFEDAIDSFENSRRLNSTYSWIIVTIMHLKLKICNWSDYDVYVKDLFTQVKNNFKRSSPFLTLVLRDSLLEQRQAAETYTEENHPLNTSLGPLFLNLNNKIRIGYFSSDFRVHPVSTLIAELFELHDKTKLEIIAFSFGEDDKSSMRLRMSKSFDQFIDVRELTDSSIANLARELSIDIAVDLGGYTIQSRPDIFAYRAAPIQLSYIGYLGTSGAPYIDYIIADKTIVPLRSQNYYSEKIIYLPSYQVNDRKRKISHRQFSRKDFGLPISSFIFCCFNNNYKILPATFDGWMRILKAVDHSILFLYAENKWVKSSLINEALKRGVSSERLFFGVHLEIDEYLSRYQICDLFLDTFPYNAGTTASDALWAGLPVLTKMGETFASRMAASVLTAIDLPELITHSQEQYESLAIELATNPAKLKEIKIKLVANRLTMPLFDTPRFTRNLEKAYTKMYERYRANLTPDHIYIQEESSLSHSP